MKTKFKQTVAQKLPAILGDKGDVPQEGTTSLRNMAGLNNTYARTMFGLAKEMFSGNSKAEATPLDRLRLGSSYLTSGIVDVVQANIYRLVAAVMREK